MPIYEVQGPDGRIYQVEGPAGASEKQVVGALMQQLGGVKRPDLSALRKSTEPETGFAAGFKSGSQRLLGDMYAIGAAAGVEGAEAKAKEQRDKAAQTYRQPEFLEKPVDYVTGLLGQSLPYMAAPVVAGVAASPLGAIPAMGLAGLASATQFSGSNMSRQMEEGVAAKDLNVAGAVGASIPQAALDVVGFRFVPGLRRIFGAAGKELTEQQAQNVMRHYLANTAKTATAEGLTEAGQQVLERAQAGLNLTDPQARQEYFDNFMGGAILGGTLSIPGTYVERGRDEDRRQQKAAADAKAAQDKAAADAAAAAEAKQQQLQDPAYALQVADRFEALKQREKELQGELKKKLPKDADDEAVAQREELVAQMRELRSQLQELAPDYKAVKPRLAEYRERQRVEGMSPEDVFNERLDAQAAEWGKGQPAAKPIKEEPYTLDSWLDQTANTPAPAAQVAPDQQQQDLDAALEGLRYHDILTPSEVAKVVSNDLGLVKRLYDGTVTIPEFNRRELSELRDALKLQLNTLKGNRKEVEGIQKVVDDETAALQRIGENPNPEITSPTQLGLTNELQNLADQMQPGTSVEAGLQKQNYRAKADEFRQELTDALVSIQEAKTDIEKGNALDSEFGANRRLASSTTDTLRSRIEKEKPRYVDSVMNEVANLRAAENQQPLTAELVKLATAQLRTAIDAYATGQATDAQLNRQLDVIRARLLTWRPALQKNPLETGDTLEMQGNNREAQRVEEARGDTAQTLEGQLRRKRDYTDSLIEKALGIDRRSNLGYTLPLDARRLLERTRDAIADARATNDVLDQAGDIADRALRGQLTRTEVGKLREALDLMDKSRGERSPESFAKEIAEVEKELAQTDPENKARIENLQQRRNNLLAYQREAGRADTQGNLFADDEKGGKNELGFIRQSAANFQRFMNSALVKQLKAMLPKVQQAVAREARVQERPGVDVEFYRSRIDALEAQIAEAKSDLEALGTASWEQIVNASYRLPTEVQQARQKLVKLLQEQNKLEIEEREAIKQKPSGTRPPYEAANTQNKARKLKDEIEAQKVGLANTLTKLTEKIKLDRRSAIYGPMIAEFEKRAAQYEQQLAEIESSMPKGGAMSEDFDAMFDEADTLRTELRKAQQALEEVRTRAEKSDGNEALLAAADKRVQKEKAKLKELEDTLGKVDLVGEARRKVAAEAAAMRRAVAVVDKKLAEAKDAQRKNVEAAKMRIATGEGTLKTRRTVEAVERENPKTGEKVILMEKGTDNPVLQKKTEGAYAARTPVKGVDWKSRKKAKPALTPTPDTAEEPVAKAQRAGAKENLNDYATVASTLARQAAVTDVAPRPDTTRPLRTAQGSDAASRFAKNDARVLAAKEQHGVKSEQYKRALLAARQKYFEKLAKEAEANDGTVFRTGEAVTTPVDSAQAKAFIDKVKAGLPKGVKVVYVNNLSEAPAALIQSMARNGMDAVADTVKGAVLADGTVVIVGNHHGSMVDLEKTVVHELAHYGTDTLLGKDGMNALYKALEKNDGGIMAVARELGVDEDVQEVALEYGRRYEAAQARGASKEELAAIKEAGQQQALREMLAHVAEAKVDKSFLQKAGDFIKAIIGAVRAALRKMGFAELAKASTSDIFYVLRQAHTGVYNGTLAAYKAPNGETVFRRGEAVYSSSANPAFAAFNAKTGVGKAEAPNKVFSAATGIGFKTAMVDRFAPLKAVADYMKNSAQAMQMMYYARMHDQRMAFTATTATNGARTIAQDEKGNYIIKEAGTASLKDVADTLANVKGLGNAAAVRNAFDAYLKAHRAKRVGGKALNFDNPPTPAEIQATIDAGDAVPEFVQARKQYNEYNRGLINWLVQSGAISKKLGKELSSTDDYVPFYRVEKDNVLFEIGDRAPITIGDLKNQPYLQELVGGKEDTKDFFTAALQNTAMLTDMGLRNLATKETAFALQSAGLLGGVVNEKTGKTRGIFKGSGPDSDKIIRFKIDGEAYHALVDTDAVGVPADVLVQGMHGTVTQMGGFVKLMAVPARFMRAMITRNPVYSVRQIVRDSTSNFLLTGGNTTPVVSALNELGKMWAGKSDGEKALQQRGVLGGQIITGTSEDMQKILLQLVAGKPGWETALAKLDSVAMKADASSRVALYNDFRNKQGLSDMEATLAALEAMNFSKRGTSGTLYKLNMMVPFLNAQIQGLNVLWEAFTGKLPYAQALKQRQKFYTRAAMLGASTLMYAAMMSDDEAYKNASLRDRLQNWFVKIPGVDAPIKVPIPFEAGLIFKALPEALALMSQDDEKSSEVLKALGEMVAMSTPVGVSTQPQAIKPLIEAYLGKSFFTGRDIESASEQMLMPGERVRGGTSELAKMVSAATGGTVSPLMIEHFVNGYTGSMGLAIMQSANAILPADTAAPTKRLNEMPVIGSLFQARDAQGQISSMYDRAKRYEQVKNTFDKLVDEGRGADATALAQRYSKEIAFADIASDFKKDVGEFSKIERQIRASALSPDEKRARLDEVRQAKIAMAKAFNAAALRE